MALNPNASIKYQDTEEGWVGDVPKIELSMEKLNATGWEEFNVGYSSSTKNNYRYINFK